MIGALTWVTTAVAALALHPYHVALGEAELVEEGARLEVSLEVFGEDLERALSLIEGEPVDLETTPDVEDKIAAYVAKNWLWRRVGDVDEPDGGWPPSDLEWYGMDLGPRDTVLYFTVGVPGRLDELEMTLRILFEVEAGQSNSLTIKVDQWKGSLTFKPEEPWQRAMPGPAPEPTPEPTPEPSPEPSPEPRPAPEPSPIPEPAPG